MALSNQRQTPIVVDLTLDSDAESEDGAIPPAHVIATASMTMTAPSMISSPFTTTSRANRHRPPTDTVATIEHTASKVQDIRTSLREQERGAKRRKLSGSSSMAATHVDSRSQSGAVKPKPPCEPGTNSTIAQNAPRTCAPVARPTNFLGMLSANGKLSSSFMNAALKPSISSVPSLDNITEPAARPLSFARTHDQDIEPRLSSSIKIWPESGSTIANEQPPRHSCAHDGMQRIQQATPGKVPILPPNPRYISPIQPGIPVENDEHRDGDSMISDLPLRQSTPCKVPQSPGPQREHAPGLLPTVSMPLNPQQMTNFGATPDPDHLLIFLKEVKKLKWSDITAEFSKDIPGRNYPQLQSRYSSVLNKRDRSEDPPILNLPSRFAAEAIIDWPTIHGNIAPSRSKRGLADARSTKPPRAARQVRDDAVSSGTDSAPSTHRARRAAAVNYAWPLLQSMTGGFEELPDVDQSRLGSMRSQTRSRSGSPFDKQSVTTGRNSRGHCKPLKMNFEPQDAELGLVMHGRLQDRKQHRAPYLSLPERLAMRKNSAGWVWDQSSIHHWQGTVIHVDLSPAEMQTVEKVIKEMTSYTETRHSTYRRHLRAILKGLTPPKIEMLIYEICRRLLTRDTKSIASFLEDAAAGKLSDLPQIQRLASVVDPSSTLKISLPACIRQRELGLQSRRGHYTASIAVTYRLKNQLTDSMGPKSTWTGASSDVHTVAWSRDGQRFAGGAVAVTDANSMQYNRPNVLVYGNTTSENIYELREHYIDRPKTEVGVNSTHAMYVSQDPVLYTTVTAVAFSPSDRLMYSAGYDHSVCIWDVSAASQQPRIVHKIGHAAPVDCLAVNQVFPEMIATAIQRTTDKSTKLLRFTEEELRSQDWRPVEADFASAKAQERPHLKMSVNALKFDPTGRFLLAGFGANVQEDNGMDTSGDICLWDVETQADLRVHGSSRNVFDLTFNAVPRERGIFAVGCVANGNVNRGTGSVVRFYSPKEMKFTCPLELECKALDMNDVVWCPYDENLFAAGCTDGRSYVWDLRMPSTLLYTLGHGSSLMPLEDGVPHERTDTGVRFLSWGQNARRLYSGSSDGVVKVWDVTQSQHDVFVKDIITTSSGIMSAAFTSDFSKLVVGEVNGSVDVLEVGRDDIALKDADKLSYNHYLGKADDSAVRIMAVDYLPNSPEVVAADAREWLETQQLCIAPMGGFPKHQVLQGPKYVGPFDCSNDATSLREDAFRFQQRLARVDGLQCDLPSCKHTSTTTCEDIGNSGRSADRIPNELRRQWLDESSRTVPGRSRCIHCRRPAIPALDGASCEHCSFTCFRCGGIGSVTSDLSILECTSCRAVWDVGALGFECAQQPAIAGRELDVPALKTFGKEAYTERLEDANTAFGDEMNALSDHYFSLAMDRPESPPL